jgi:hypothetical protein
MIRDRDHQLCQQRFSSLTAGLDQMWLDLDDIQADTSSLSLAHNRVAAACKSETSPMAAQRTFTNGRRPPVMQPVANSRSAEFWSNDRRSTCFQIGHKCQKES